MHFLVEHQMNDDVRIAVCDTLSDVRLIAEDLVGDEHRLIERGQGPRWSIGGARDRRHIGVVLAAVARHSNLSYGGLVHERRHPGLTWLTVALGAALIVPGGARAAPEVVDVRWPSQPRVGERATVEIFVRDAESWVDEISVDFGDNTGPVWAYLAQPLFPEPGAVTGPIRIWHDFARPGDYTGTVIAYTFPTPTAPTKPVAESEPYRFVSEVAPCARPQLRVATSRGPGRRFTLEARASDLDTVMDHVVVRWGDGARTRRRHVARGTEAHGTAAKWRVRHSYSQPGRYTIRIAAVSGPNPRRCGAAREYVRRRLTARISG